jgi:hypothetical protein
MKDTSSHLEKKTTENLEKPPYVMYIIVSLDTHINLVGSGAEPLHQTFARKFISSPFEEQNVAKVSLLP